VLNLLGEYGFNFGEQVALAIANVLIFLNPDFRTTEFEGL